VIVYLSTIFIFGGILYLFLPVFVNELSNVLALLPPDSTLAGLLGEFSDGGIFASGDPVAILTELRTIVGGLSSQFVQGTTAVFGGLMSVGLVLVLSFYFAMQERSIEHFLRLITPRNHEKYVIDVWRRTEHKIGLWFQGQLLLALVVGVVTYLGLLLVGVPYALLLSLLSGVLALIPFGNTASLIPALLVAFAAGGWPMTLLTAGLYIIIQQFENYLFQPLIIQRATGVPSLVVILALIFGVELFGFAGLFLGIPMAVLIIEVLSDREEIELVAPKMNSK
jgi:predicted PurR-regulated permease PerM